MKTIILAAAAVSAIASVPAGAVTFTPTDGGTATFADSTVGAQYTFETATTGNVGSPTGFVRTGGQVMSGNTAGIGANPFGAPSTNHYLYVTTGAVSTISAITTAITGYQTISFYIGSIDAGNTVQLLGAGGAVLQSYTGSQLSTPMAANGQQAEPGTNRLLTFTAGAGEVLTGIRLSSSVNSLEADNVRFTAAVPEPATWAMMLVGFGMMAAGMRYRSRKTVARVAVA